MRRHRGGFTLVELLVVIGIIAVLIGILIPVVSRVRTNAHVADSKNWISQLSGAIERYHTDFHQYPGPLSNTQIWNNLTTINNVTPSTSGFDTTSPLAQGKLTMSENLTLGLLGGLNISSTGVVQYDASQVGLGPMNLNVANPKRYPPYLDATNLSWRDVVTGSGTVKSGDYLDDAGDADDTAIPEFVDRFPNPMPILYLRSRLGVDTIPSTASGYGPKYNSVITDDRDLTGTPPRAGAYDTSQYYGYVVGKQLGAMNPSFIGVGRENKQSEYVPSVMTPPYPQGLATVSPTASMNKSPPSGYTYKFPYDAFPYFQSASTPNVPRQKDGYILISPGRDRTYGTNDDICSFGDVNP